jgi:hypothetical protein
VEAGLGREHRRDRALRIALDLAVAALQRTDRGADLGRVVLQRRARHAQHQLRVGGSAVVVDAELADARPLLAQRDALDVPERRRACDTACEQRLDGLEADRDGPDSIGVAAVACHDRAENGLVRGQPAHPGPLPLERCGRPDRGLCEHGRERALHERHHADDVAALLAREPEVVDVEDRHVGAARLQQLQRVGRGARLADLQLDALGLVVAALGRHVDAGVDGVGREVEQQRRLRAGPVLPAGGAAAGGGHGEERS